jgi:hypothetical protein
MFLFLGLAPALAAAADEAGERNKMLARRFLEEAWFLGHSAYAAEAFAPRYVVFDARQRSGIEESRDVQVNLARQWCTGGADCSKSEIMWQVAEGDRVATYWVFRYQPSGALARTMAGMFGRLPVEAPVVNIFRFEDGKIVEAVNQRDDLGIFQGMGVLNLAIVVTFALGGALGILLSVILQKAMRRRS